MGERADVADNEIGAVKDHIRQTREEMSDTVDAIKTKLSPSNMVAEAKDTIRETAAEKVMSAELALHHAVDTAWSAASAAVNATKQMLRDPAGTAKTAGTAVVDTVRKRPALVAIVGLGIGWLFFMRARRNRA